MDSMSLTCSVARKAVIRNTHKGHQGGRLAQEYRASFKQVQRSRMAALRATLRAKARASVPALRQLERRPVFLHCRALPRKLSLWLNTSNSLNPCTRYCFWASIAVKAAVRISFFQRIPVIQHCNLWLLNINTHGVMNLNEQSVRIQLQQAGVLEES